MNVHDAPHRRLGDPCCGAARLSAQNPSRLHARNSERCAAAQRYRAPEQLSSEVAKYGPPSAGSGMLPLEGSGTYSARQRVVTRYGGARPPGAPSLASHVIPTSAARKPIALRREPTLLAASTPGWWLTVTHARAPEQTQRRATPRSAQTARAWLRCGAGG